MKEVLEFCSVSTHHLKVSFEFLYGTGERVGHWCWGILFVILNEMKIEGRSPSCYHWEVSINLTRLSYRLIPMAKLYSLLLSTLFLRDNHCKPPRRTQWHPHHFLQGCPGPSWSPQSSTDYSDYMRCCPWYQLSCLRLHHPKGQHILGSSRWSNPRQR